MNKYTDIGEAVVTSSTISGKAKIHVVQGRGFRNLAGLLLAAALLGMAAAFWLGRGEQPVSVPAAGLAADKPADEKSAPQPERMSHKPADQPAARAEESQPKETPPPAGASLQANVPSKQQQAENALRNAQQLAQQGKVNGALESYRAALLLDPTNDSARQAMVDLLLKLRRSADAERALQLGLKYNPKQSRYAVQLAHLQEAQNELPQALDTLMKSLPYAAQQADYLAFVAALLQRQNRHQDAVVYYQKALELQPTSGEWLMGMGISLRAGKRLDEARDAFRRAQESKTLSPQSRAFVEEQLKEPAVAQPPSASQ